MADEEKNEKTEKTAEETVEETPSAEVEAEAPEAGAVEAAPVEAESPAAEETQAEEAPAAEKAPAAEEVPDTAGEQAPASDEAPDTPQEAAPAKPAKSQRHLPRSARRARTKAPREQPATRKPITRTAAPEPELGRRQERRGVVVSDKGDKTIVVKVDQIKSHRKYRKVVRRSTKFHAHDEGNQAGVGDTVRIVETRPISKSKRWRLAEIVEKAR